MSEKEEDSSEHERDDDDVAGRREANPRERELSFARQRSAVIRPRGSAAPAESAADDQPGECAEGTQPSRTFRQERMAEYRERQQTRKPSGGGASDES
jgi:hypothetical protein